MSSPSDRKKPAAAARPGTEAGVKPAAGAKGTAGVKSAAAAGSGGAAQASARAAAAMAAAGDTANRVSLRRRATTTETFTSSAAEGAIQKVLERRELKRQGKLPPPEPARSLLQSAGDEVAYVINGSLTQLGLPQWAFRAIMLLVVTAVMGGAVAKIALREGPPCPTHPLTGILKIAGAVPVGASIVLHPQGNAIPGDGVPMATVRDDGTFTFSTFASDDGVPAGDYVATVQWFRVNADGSVGGNAVPARFASPATSPWRITVAEGGDTLDPYQITR